MAEESLNMYKQVYGIIVRLAYENQTSNPHSQLASVEKTRLEKEVKSTLNLPSTMLEAILKKLEEKPAKKIHRRSQQTIEGKTVDYIIPNSPTWQGL